MTRGVVELRYDGSFLDDGKPVPANRIGAINGELFSSANGLAFYAAGRLWDQAEYDDIDPVMHSIGSDQLLCADPGSREVRRFLVGLRDRKIWIPGGRAMPPPCARPCCCSPGWMAGIGSRGGRLHTALEWRSLSRGVGMSEQYGVGDASYRAAGGIEGLHRLVDDFYRYMDELPEAAAVRALHPANLDEARDKLACFLSGWLGGPKLFGEKYGPVAIPSFHAQWSIDEAQADAWLSCMAYAIARQGYAPAFAEYLLAQLRVPARRIVQASTARHG